MKEKIADKFQVVLYIAFIALLICAFANKKNLHVDEILTYGLSNDSYGLAMSVWGGSQYEPAEKPFLNYIGADGEERFNYTNVWNNQSIDVHPPLYYTILHTVCSLFPGQYSVWFGGSINIVFAVLTFYVLRKLAAELFEDKFPREMVAVLFVLAAGILSSITFIRMYTLAMFFVTLITYFFVNSVDKQWSWKQYLSLFLVSVLSALTHYYCIVYLVFICIVYGIYLLFKKKWAHTAAFCGVMPASAVMAVKIFPAMLDHVFSGYRGTESIENFTNTSFTEYLEHLKGFYSIINEQIFGGALTYGLIFFAAMGILFPFIKKYLPMKESGKNTDTEDKNAGRVKWLLVMIPTMLYFLILSKMAVYVIERYLSPIYAVIVVLGIGMLYYGIKKIITDKYKNMVLGLIGAVMILGTWRTEQWQYLNKDSVVLLDKAAEYSDVDCVVVYDLMYQAQLSFYEVSNYKSVTFFLPEELYWEWDLEWMDDEELMVVLIGQDENTLSVLLEMCPKLDSYEVVGGFGYGTTYRLYAQ